MKKIQLAFLIGIIMTLITGCGYSGHKTEKDLKQCKIAVLLPGNINDLSWNEANYEGIVNCEKELGIHIEYKENTQEADFEEELSACGEKKCDLVIAAGAQFDDAVEVVAPKYPDTVFSVINGIKCEGDNVAPVFLKEYEASYLASIIAGNIAKDGTIGMIAGYPNTAMEQLLDVYENNTENILNERGIGRVQVLRAYTNSWNDTELTEKISEQILTGGTKLLFVYANEASLACIETAKRYDAKVVGFCNDQTTKHPDTVVASIKFDLGKVYSLALKLFAEGRLKGNDIHEMGIKDDIFVPVYSEDIPQDVRDKVEEGILDFKQGKINLKQFYENMVFGADRRTFDLSEKRRGEIYPAETV